MSYSPNLTIYLTSTLYHPSLRPYICVRNLVGGTFNGTVKFRSIEYSSMGDVMSVTAPVGTSCFITPEFSPLPPGESILWAEGNLGTTPVITNTVSVYYSREYVPSYTVDPGIFRIWGFSKFNYWGGVYRLSYLPRAQDVDFLYVEDYNGNFDILSRADMEANTLPKLDKTAKLITLEYAFSNRDHLDRFLQSFTRHILDQYMYLDDINIVDRIKIMIHILNYVMKPLNIMRIELDQNWIENNKIIFNFVFTGGTPILVLTGAVIFGLGLLGGIVISNVLSKSTTNDVAVIYNVRDTSNNILRAQTQQINTLIDALDPALFKISKETVKSEINRIAEQAISENTRIADIHATNLAGRQVGISLTDKLIYAGVGAGAGILAYLILRGGR